MIDDKNLPQPLSWGLNKQFLDAYLGNQVHSRNQPLVMFVNLRKLPWLVHKSVSLGNCCCLYGSKHAALWTTLQSILFKTMLDININVMCVYNSLYGFPAFPEWVSKLFERVVKGGILCTNLSCQFCGRCRTPIIIIITNTRFIVLFG